MSGCVSQPRDRGSNPRSGTKINRGASPLELPYTRSRSALRRLAPIAWLTRCARSLRASDGRAGLRPRTSEQRPHRLSANGRCGLRARSAQILDLFAEDSWRNVYAGELEVRPPDARPADDTTASVVASRRASAPRRRPASGREDYFSRTIVNEPGRAAGWTTHPAFNVILQPSPCSVVPSSGAVTGTDSVAPSAARKTPSLALRRPH